MSDGRQTPDNAGPDMGPPGSAMPSSDNDGSKKPSSNLKPAFDDGALKVMEEEFQVGIASLDERWAHFVHVVRAQRARGRRSKLGQIPERIREAPSGAAEIARQ